MGKFVIGTFVGAFLFYALVGCCGPRGRTGAAGQSIVGPKGPEGDRGFNGTNGTDGLNGADAVPVTVVNLCPGASNYGVFVETAICLNNNLYGVYSANGGFLTLLAPGSYSSNAIGSACSLTVGPNCTVSH